MPKIILEPVTVQLIETIENNKDYQQNEKFPVTYFSLCCADFDDYDLQDKIIEYGERYVYFLLFLKRKMLQKGKYYIFERNIKRLINEYCFTYNAELDNVMNIYNSLVENNYITIIKCPCFEEPILTEANVIYTFRLVQEQRVKNRLKQRKARAKAKDNESENTEETKIEEAPSEPDFNIEDVPTTEPDMPIKPDDFGFGEYDNDEIPFFNERRKDYEKKI